jgi:hypothetical protein
MKNHDKKYEMFILMCKTLNKEFNITPILFGSLGLEVLSGYDFNADDIDVLIPGIYLDEKWNLIRIIVESLGYRFKDLHEHEFIKNNVKLAFGIEESLLDFANINWRKLKSINDFGAKYKLLNYSEYLMVYKQSYQDSYRRDKNNGKDLSKIEYLEKLVSNH